MTGIEPAHPAGMARRFRTGDRVLVIPVQQIGVVRGRKEGRVMVHFGTQNMVQAWAWYHPADLERIADMVEVVLP